MAGKVSTRTLALIIVVIIVVVAGFIGYQYWKNRNALPEGIASGNGRIETKLVDIGPKESLRIKEILVDEGNQVKAGQVIVRMDTDTLDAELAQAKANIASAKARVAISDAAIIRVKSDIELARIELERAKNLLSEKAGSQRDYDVRKTKLETTTAMLAEEQAKLEAANQEVQAAQENANVVQTRINDATLKSPVRGRVLYRLAEVGEVLPAGGKAMTIINLSDVYMEIFLPAEQATKVKIGAEGRITVDYAPGRAAPGYVSFVSPEAQFTPKYVETRSEREKLMFRVKIRVPEQLVAPYIESIKTGVRGVGYVKVVESASWPDWLNNLVTPPQGTAMMNSPNPVSEAQK